jgi:hypothetical protein
MSASIDRSVDAVADAAMAAWRAVQRERIKNGLDRARERGARLGRPCGVNIVEHMDIVLDTAFSVADVCGILGVCRDTVYRHRRAHGVRSGRSAPARRPRLPRHYQKPMRAAKYRTHAMSDPWKRSAWFDVRGEKWLVMEPAVMR